MPISGFNHFNIMTGDLDRARRFYRDVLGMTDGTRPPFGRPGAWMYIGEQAVLHISTGRAAKTKQSDAFDHIAFTAHDVEGTCAHLRKHGIVFEEYPVPDRRLVQIFFRDPDGVEIELQFNDVDVPAAVGAGDASRGHKK